MDRTKILEKDKERYEILRWIFDEADGDETNLVHLRKLIEGETDYIKIVSLERELGAISDYLTGENLIEQKADNGLLIQLTHQGIIEVEESIRNPDRPTEHFSVPAIQNFQYTFNAPVGSVQQGNQNIASVQQNFGSKTEEVINLLKELQKHISDDNKQEGLEYIEGLETEVKSEKLSESRIKLFLKGLGGVVKDTGKELLTEVGKKVITGEIQLG